ncbi:hypothetical protein ACFH04_13260 [Streptomyces noboritoensis]|uniref:N-acetyltransferase domain-containing protein n=1 Tax=Streptomyces noboritoensis TaxID=67337 RepID=A0ABV6TFU3_9ACTN
MYVIRPAVPADADGITRVIDHRCTHHLVRHDELVRNDGDLIRRLLTHPGESRDRVWVFTDETAARDRLTISDEAPLVACLTLTERLPHWSLWTREECAEPSLSIDSLYTDPAPEQRRTGWMMHCWVVDHVARTYRQAEWVRCVVAHPRVMRYMRDQWGWEYVRSGPGADGSAAHLLQHRPEAKPGLAALITTGQPTSAL